MYKWNVSGVTTAYMYTAYKQGMFVISVQMQWNSLHKFITEMISMTVISNFIELELLSCEIHMKYFGFALGKFR